MTGATTPTQDAPLPVTAVTCLEDRAQVERAVTVELAEGVQRLRLGPLTALAVDRTLRAETAAPGTRVLEARLVRTWAPRAPLPPGPEDSALRHRLHALEAEYRQTEQARARLDARLALLAQLSADLLREIGEGAGVGEIERTRWARELDRVDAERERHGEELRATHSRLRRLDQERSQALTALDEAEEEPAELHAHLELTVEAERPGPAELTVSHLVPCALWRPSYRATLSVGGTGNGDTNNGHTNNDGTDSGSTAGGLRLESEAVVWQRTGEDWTGARLTFSTARSALATDPPALTEDVLTLRERTGEERRTVEVELREEAIGELGPTATVPGLDDGGEVRVLTAPAPATVPSDGRAHRVPLGAFTGPASSEYACAPELSPLVTQVVRFRNAAGHPLLAGPVELVRGSGFTGRGELRFTATGADAELSFGSSDGYRVVREAEERQATTALTGRQTTTRTVRLHLSRFSGPEERDEQLVTVRERVPVSEVAAVEVRLRKEDCSPAPDSFDAEGIVRWDVPLAPGARHTLTLVYEIAASAKVAGL
ncbi:mucoidy inhibitor MuiA family protein [Kitasatospora sp. SUK 42]|uniref:mucoidy inhibitor MuiA family protein n=1 Tax=Kitasatospora sp. SUK 42 TaxID=1588882 RepID=UPI0018C97D51|nr:mucoidy inhibitor MuiA family protein [Kitasatospora sp. SUK 42]MBV2151291.1 mucoidy inhibitor MuiA family protein [Kitasatospora sp. SUK 42]